MSICVTVCDPYIMLEQAINCVRGYAVNRPNRMTEPKFSDFGVHNSRNIFVCISFNCTHWNSTKEEWHIRTYRFTTSAHFSLEELFFMLTCDVWTNTVRFLEICTSQSKYLCISLKVCIFTLIRRRTHVVYVYCILSLFEALACDQVVSHSIELKAVAVGCVRGGQVLQLLKPLATLSDIG